MTLGLGRANVARIPADEAYRMDVDALAAAIAEDRAAGRRPIAIVATVGTTSSTSRRPGRRDRRRRRARTAVAARGCRVRRRGRADPGAARAVRGLGAGRFDRREPAQVAVHAARRVAVADAPNGRAAGGIQPRARVPAHARSRVTGPRLQRVHAAARPPVPGAEAVAAAALVRPRRASPADRAAHRASRRSSRAGSPPTRTSSAGAGAVLDGLLPVSGRAGLAATRRRGPLPRNRCSRR